METTDGVYLCQVSDNVSCGACCGLYNMADASRQGICRVLEKRTAAFAGLPREIEEIVEFGRKESRKVVREGIPMPRFHHCPYLGFIGPEKSRVGCMLHPAAENNQGIDLRGLSYYGSMTCRMYFCPTHQRISDSFKAILCMAVDDWYLFGLLIQDAPLLTAFSDQITARTGGRFPRPETISDSGTLKLWKRLFELKITWPFASASRPLATYFFNDELYSKPLVDYSKTGRMGSEYDAVFRNLDSVFDSGAMLREAEDLLDEVFGALAQQ